MLMMILHKSKFLAYVIEADMPMQVVVSVVWIAERPFFFCQSSCMIMRIVVCPFLFATL